MYILKTFHLYQLFEIDDFSLNMSKIHWKFRFSFWNWQNLIWNSDFLMENRIIFVFVEIFSLKMEKFNSKFKNFYLNWETFIWNCDFLYEIRNWQYRPKIIATKFILSNGESNRKILSFNIKSWLVHLKLGIFWYFH